MNLPDIKAAVRIFESEAGAATLLGFADLTVGGAFAIRGIRILKSKSGEDGEPGHIFLSFPAKPGKGEKQNQWYEIACPVTSEARKAAQEAIVAAYEEVKRSSGE
ncbi:MAG: septation protein SpoVG family protein [Elusimicrobia bacterium]|nr:septation protein SpoVG family protein [Elusimicrobiota bacterium]MDE2312759.1 septation protein SpoVG family protein [Elusimicrobiota bacterium]